MKPVLRNARFRSRMLPVLVPLRGQSKNSRRASPTFSYWSPFPPPPGSFPPAPRSVPGSPRTKTINIKFPCSLTRNVTSHSMENLAFHSLVRWKMIILRFSLLHFYISPVGRMCSLYLGVPGRWTIRSSEVSGLSGGEQSRGWDTGAINNADSVFFWNIGNSGVGSGHFVLLH